MPGSNNLLRPDEDNGSESSEFIDPNDTNVEFLSTTSGHDAPVPKDYWFGKRYFECVLAQDLLLSTPIQESISAIDSKLDSTVRFYSYHRGWDFLSAEGLTGPWSSSPKSDEECREALLSLAGTIVRQGTTKEKHLLLSTIRKFKDARASENCRSADTSQSDQDRDEDQPLPDPHSALDENLASLSISMCTSLLKERGDRIGVSPRYSSQIVSLDPPVFKEVVFFQGHTFEGTARTKKQAKHEASKKACDYFGYSLQ